MPLPYGQSIATLISSPQIAYPGLVLQRDITKEAINLAGAAAQVVTIVIGTLTASTVYTITINGISTSVTSAASGTMAQLQAQIVDRLSTIPSISGNFAITTTGSDTVILTATSIAPNSTVAVGALLTVTNTASTVAKRIRFGRIVTGRPQWIDNLQVAGLPSASTEKVLGATQYSHGNARDQGTLGGFISGDTMSLIKSGQIWMEFSSMIVAPAAAGVLYYRSVADVNDPEGSGRLAFGTSAPTDHTLLPGTWSLDTATSTIADGRIVGLVTISV